MRRGRAALLAAVALTVPLMAHAQTPSLPLIPGLPNVSCLPPVVIGVAPAAVAPDPRPPIALVFAGGVCLDLSSFIQPAPGGFLLQASNLPLDNVAVLNQLTVDFDTDPFINFSLATTSLVPGPTTFTFLFGTPITPGTYSQATSSLAGSLTAGQSTAQVANSGVAPTFLTGYGTFNLTSTDLGVGAGTGPCTTNTSVNCPASPATNSNTFGPTTFNNLEALVTYDQSGLTSQATFSGRVDLFVATVPEPTSATLVLSGVLVVGAAALRRRRHT